MLIDKYIEELTKLRQAHGPGLEVMRASTTGVAVKSPLPRIGYRHKRNRARFWSDDSLDKDKGEKVVRV
jgi:hypothetical protein